MNQHAPGNWQDLAQVWQTGKAPITSAEVERLLERQRRRLRTARAAEMVCTILGVMAALCLTLVSRLRWVGILTAVFSVASMIFVLRAQRQPAPQGSSDLLESLQESLAYHDWLGEQLRYGRALGFIALFAVAMAASTQLMHLASTTQSGLLATAAAGLAICIALAWNMALAWHVWRRTARLKIFRQKLATDPTLPG